VGDEDIGDRFTNAHRETESRGRRGEPSPAEMARQFAREHAPTRSEQEKWFGPRGDQTPPDLHLQFFKDLITLSSSSAVSPLSPSQARGIKQRWGMDAPYVIDPEARQAALLGFELVLTLACFVPPVAGFATGMLVIMGLVRGESGLSLAAGAIPIGRLKLAEKALRALMTLGRVFKPANMAQYQKVAAELLARDKNLMKSVGAQLKTLTSPQEKDAVRMAIAAYKLEKQATGNAHRAARAAGAAFHKTMKAPPEGADRVRKATMEILEFKTHYSPIVDEFVLAGGREQVLGYVLKEIAEKSLWFKGRVLHVFIDPTGRYAARRLVIDPIQEEKLVEALLRLSKK
jgi:hypothetical protein